MIRGIAILAIAWLASAASAFAYEGRDCYGTPLRYRGTTGTVNLWSGSFPAGPWRTGALNAFNRLNTTHPGNYRLDNPIDTFNVSVGNGESEMWFTTDSLWLGGDNSPAMAHWRDICIWFFGISDGYYVNEGDVLIDPEQPWTLSELKRDDGAYGGTGRQFRTIVMHEVGHGLGFNHNNYNYNIMGDDFTHLHVNGPLARGYMGEDISAGMLAHYGPKPAWEDLSVSHWRYIGRNGEYSMHGKVDIIGAGGVLPTRFIDGEDHFEVTPGQWLFPRFTYENTGINCHTRVLVGFYLSTNDSISTSDRRIGETRVNLCPRAPDTRTVFVRLPSDIPAGPLWLGTIVNDDRAVTGERSTANNATYIPLWVN